MKVYAVLSIENDNGKLKDTCLVFNSLSKAKKCLQDFYYYDCRTYNFDDEINKKVEDSYHLLDEDDLTFEIVCKIITFDMESE